MHRGYSYGINTFMGIDVANKQGAVYVNGREVGFDAEVFAAEEGKTMTWR